MLLAALVTGASPALSAAGPPSPSAAAGAAPTRAVAGAARWQWPLDPAPAVVHAFHAPPTPWSAGHRGVDLAAHVGAPVLAAGAGQVTFAGSVAGRGVMVVTHPGGLRTSFEPVAATVAVGAAVRPGQPIGLVQAVPGHCAPRACLHWGLRRGQVYLDPLSLLGEGPPVLKPWAGLGRGPP